MFLGLSSGRHMLKVFAVGFFLGVAVEGSSYWVLDDRGSVLDARGRLLQESFFPVRVFLQRYDPFVSYSVSDDGAPLISPDAATLRIHTAFALAGIGGGIATMILWYALRLGRAVEHVRSACQQRVLRNAAAPDVESADSEK